MRAAYTFVVAALVLSSLCNAYTDFAGMSAPHKREVHPDGTIRLSQDVHHTFEKHGTFFKATYNAHHEDKWHIVDLSKEVTGFSDNFRCSGNGESELYIRNPTAELIALLRKQDLKHTVVTAHPRHHCHGKAIFRHVVELTEEPGRLVVKTTRAQYNEVFRDLKLSVTTNHVFTKTASPTVPSTASSGVSSRGQSSARGYLTQSWWHHFTSAVSHTVHDVVHTVEHAATAVATTVEHAATTVAHVAEAAVEIIGGDYSKDAVWDLPGVNYNKNGHQDNTFANGLVDTHATGAVSFVLTPTIHFDIDIKTWRLDNLEIYFEGDAEAAVSASFQATLQKTISKTMQVADIHLSTITFAIGPVPFVISPSIPINAGFTLNIDGQLAVGASFQASATTKHGFSYTHGNGFAAIKEDSYTFTHDFSPKTYSIDVGLTAFIQPVVTVVIDGIVHGGVGAAIYGDVLVQSNKQCIFDLNLDIRPVISLTASIGLSIAGHDIFNKQFGPLTVWTHTYPIYSYCKPNPIGQYMSSGRNFALQVADSSTTILPSNPVLLNSRAVSRTTFAALDDGNIGKVWSGRSVSCGFVDMHYSIRFALGELENTSLAILSISQSRIPSYRTTSAHGLASATGVITYTAMGLPSVSGSLTYTVLNASDAYVATTNATELPMNIPTTLTLTFSPTDIRFVSMSSDLVCGSVSLEAPEANDDNTTFNYFKRLQETAGAASNSASASSTDSSSSASSIGLIVYAAVATCMTIIATGSAIHFRSKSRYVPVSASQKLPSDENNLGALINDNTGDIALTERSEEA